MDIGHIDCAEFARFGIDPKNIGLAIQLRQLLLQKNVQLELMEPTMSGGIESKKQQLVDEGDVERAVALAIACCAFFHGFEEIDDQSLKAFHRILAAKFDRMCGQLQLLANRKRRGRPTAFNNPVHQVLHAHSLPVQELMEFYQSRVIKPCQRIAEKFIAERKRRKKEVDGKKDGGEIK